MSTIAVQRRFLLLLSLATLSLLTLSPACAQTSEAKPSKEATATASVGESKDKPTETKSTPSEAKATSVHVPDSDLPKATSPVEGAYGSSSPPPRAGVTPPDGVWLTDEAGNQFYIEKLKRYEGKYKWIGENRVNYMGIKIDIVDADEDWFYMKAYRVPEEDPLPPSKGPTPEDLAAVAAEYKVSLTETDELQFVAFDRGLPATGQWRNGFVLADMNGDGLLDIVHCPPRKGSSTPIIFLNDGTGGWRPWREARFPRDYDYGDIAVGDFNGDGHNDLVLAIHLRGLRVLVGDGKGTFSEWSDGVEYQVPGQGGDNSAFSSRAVQAVDWNGDGRLDILALGEGPRVGNPSSDERKRKGLGAIAFVADGPVVYLNQGDGKWLKKYQGTGIDKIFGDDIDAGDLNGDGRIDFATSSNRMGRVDLVNVGKADGDWEAQRTDQVRLNAYIRSVSIADFNRDGRNDLAVAFLSYAIDGWRNGLDILYAQPEGGWRRQGLFARAERVALYSIGHGDLNGDRWLDLVTVDADGGMQVFLADGRGGFSFEKSPEIDKLRGRCRGYRVRLADLDGDHLDDVVVNFADEGSAMFDPQRCLNGGGLVAIKSSLKAKRTP